MIVEITSWAPVRALRKPANPPHTMPPRIPARMASGRCTTAGSEKWKPTHAAQVAPIISWPAAPMLKRPARKARATERPAKMSGVASTSVRLMASTLPSDDSKSAWYASETRFHDAERAPSGSLKNSLHWLSVSGSVKTITMAPAIRAVKMASSVNATVCNALRIRSARESARTGASGPAGSSSGSSAPSSISVIRPPPRGARRRPSGCRRCRG